METCERMAEMVGEAFRTKRRIPDFSKCYPEFDLETAYKVQKLHIQRRLSHDQIGGFKAGLISKEAQEHAGFHQPVTGVLFASGRLEGSPIVDHSRFGYLLAEQEFGFELGQSVAEALPDAESMRARVRWVRPMIELGDAGYVSNAMDTRILDLVAANCGSSHYIAGPPREPGSVELNRLLLAFTRGDEELSRWDGSKSEANHWADALWLANTVTRRGWVIEPGHILITGGLGAYFHATPGQYQADFDALGAISFAIE